MIFKEMDPDKIRELLEGQENIISPEVEKHEEYFSQLECLYCGGSCRPTLLPGQKIFEDNSLLPNYSAECNDCGCQFSPYTKIEIRGPIKDPLEDD